MAVIKATKKTLLPYERFKELWAVIQNICQRDSDFRDNLNEEGSYRCERSDTTWYGPYTESEEWGPEKEIGAVLDAFKLGINEFDCDMHILLPKEAAYAICRPALIHHDNGHKWLIVQGSLEGPQDLFWGNSNNILNAFIDTNKNIIIKNKDMSSVINPSWIEAIRKNSTQAVLIGEGSKNGFKFLRTEGSGGLSEFTESRVADELANCLVKELGPVELACIYLRDDNKGSRFFATTTYLSEYSASAVLLIETV